jgi:hypothetical protein
MHADRMFGDGGSNLERIIGPIGAWSGTGSSAAVSIDTALVPQDA